VTACAKFFINMTLRHY